jgi:tetratricopeptide (TPR) repeat protein
MLSNAVLLALSSLFLSPQPLSQASPKASSDNAFENEALVFDRYETTYRMNADGTGERDMHVILRVQSEGVAQQFGVLSFGFASAYESLVIKFVRVHKADGTTVETPPTDAVEMPAAVSREAPLYSDLKEKHLPVRSLAKGDKLEYEVDTAIAKAQAPGQFWGAMHFTPPGTFVVLHEVLILEAPSSKYVQVWSPNHKPTVTEQDGIRSYSWDVAQLVPAPRSAGDNDSKPSPPKDPDEDSDGRKLPSVAWTTFHSWAEVGEWYRGLAFDQAKPVDALKARADELTRDAKSPEDQVRALYDYVSGHTRYVGIDFGIGRYQPHLAAEVLANQYGDCKDKDTLLEALLRAKGFSTAPALVGAGIAPTPDVPSPAVFNHVITTVNLPSGTIWLDSTPPDAPYRYLSQTIRDQKALVIPGDAAATLVSTPAEAPYPFQSNFNGAGSLDADGKMSAKIVATYRDDIEPSLRALARGVAPAELDKVSQLVSSAAGFSGTTSDTRFAHADDSSVPLELTYNYTRHPYGDWDNYRIVPLFPLTEFSTLASEDVAPEEDIQLGALRTMKATSRIRLPDGYRPDLPDPVHVKTDFAVFDKTYRFEQNEIVTDRQIVVLKTKVAKADWKRYLIFTKDISLSNEPWIQLYPPPKKVAVAETRPTIDSAAKPGKESLKVTVKELQAETPNPSTAPGGKTEPPPASQPEDSHAANASPEDDSSPAELMEKADQRIRSRDWTGAKEALDKVKAKNPDEKGLWADYAMLAEGKDRNYDEAQLDLKKELVAQPDNPMVVHALSEAEFRGGDEAGARETMQKFLDRHPDNLQLSQSLTSLETHENDYEAALKTLQAAEAQHPENAFLRAQVADALVHLHRNDEAAAAAKSALEGADDPLLLNNAAYELSLTGVSLDVAEEASRKSLTKLEEQSASSTTAEANSRAFGRANLLVSGWDTLGWILFREGKIDEAKGLIQAAWRSSLRPEVGDHLGQIDEAQGKKDDALIVYTLAEASRNGSVPQDLRDHMLDSIQRLKKGGAKPGPANPTEALQNLRTYHIPRPDGASGWGSFRLEVTTSGVIESQQMSGEQHLDAVKPAIEAMKFPELLPPGSKAHLLRSAVVSCSMGKTCDVVLVPDGGLQTERQ